MKPAPDRRLSSLKLKHGLWVTFPLCRSEGQSLAPPALFFSSSRPQHFLLPGRKICRPRGGASASGESTASCVHHALQHKVVLAHKIVPLQRRSMMCSDCGISWEGCTQLRLTSCCVLHTMCGSARALPHYCASRCSGKFVMKSFYIDLLLSQPAHPII